MVFRKRALAGVGREHRRVEQLGQTHQLLRGAGVEHALTGMDHRRARLQQHGGTGADVGGVGAAADRARRHVIERADLGIEHVARHLDKHRPQFAGAQMMERAPEQFADVRAGWFTARRSIW